MSTMAPSPFWGSQALMLLLLTVVVASSGPPQTGSFKLNVIFDDYNLESDDSNLATFRVQNGTTLAELRKLVLESPQGREYLEGRRAEELKCFVGGKQTSEADAQRSLAEFRLEDAKRGILFKI